MISLCMFGNDRANDLAETGEEMNCSGTKPDLVLSRAPGKHKFYIQMESTWWDEGILHSLQIGSDRNKMYISESNFMKEISSYSLGEEQ